MRDYMDIVKSRLTSPISTEEALKDVIPFDYSEDVLSGKVKVVFTADYPLPEHIASIINRHG